MLWNKREMIIRRRDQQANPRNAHLVKVVLKNEVMGATPLRQERREVELQDPLKNKR